MKNGVEFEKGCRLMKEIHFTCSNKKKGGLVSHQNSYNATDYRQTV